MHEFELHAQAAKSHPFAQTMIADALYGMPRRQMEQAFAQRGCVVVSTDDAMYVEHLGSGERWSVNKMNMRTLNPAHTIDILLRNAEAADGAHKRAWSRVPQQWWEALGE